MKTIAALISVLSVDSVIGGCHTGSSDPQWLGIETSRDTNWANTDNAPYGNIYAGGKWQGWRHLDNANCDDYVKGAVDYFDDFETVTAKWEAVALYQCKDDGILIESVEYWNGHGGFNRMAEWNPAVFGPFPQKCSYGGGQAGSSTATELYLDANGDSNSIAGCCHGVVFALTGASGTVWKGDAPGMPDCSGEYGASPPIPRLRPDSPPQPLTLYDFEAISNYYFQAMFKYLVVAAAIAALLLVSNLCLFGAVIRNRKGRTFTYQKAGCHSDDAL